MTNTEKKIQRITRKIEKLRAEDVKRAVYSMIKGGVMDETIITMSGISRGTLAAYKAHVTMGNSPV